MIRHYLIPLFTLLYLGNYSPASAQCTVTADNIYYLCLPEVPDSFFVSFRVRGDDDILDVIDLNGNQVSNAGYYADEIADGESVSEGPIVLDGPGDEEYRYFGPFANDTEIDVVLVGTGGDCDTIPVVTGSFSCTESSNICGDGLPFYNLDYQINTIDSFLIIERERGLGCSDSTCVPGNNKRCFEFQVILPDDAIGVRITDAGSGSPGGELYYAYDTSQTLCADLYESNPMGENMTSVCVPGATTFVIMSCKQGSNTTSAVVEILREPTAPRELTIEPCNVDLNVKGVGSASWYGMQDPGLDNFIFCNGDSTLCSFFYNTSVFGDVKACEGDTFYYMVNGTPDDTLCMGNGLMIDTGYVVVYPEFQVSIESACAGLNTSAVQLTAQVNCAASGCAYNYAWSNGSTEQTILVPLDSTMYSVTVSRSDVDPAMQGCIVIADSAMALSMAALDCSLVGDTAVQCIADIPVIDTALLVALGCGEIPLVFVLEEDNGGAGCPDDPYLLMRQYIGDLDGDTINTLDDQDTCFQLITVMDTIPPELDPGSCPADTSLDCSMANLSLLPVPTFMDNCFDPGEITVSVRIDTLSGFDGDCVNDTVGYLRRVFLAEDACGNVDSSCTQHVALIDTLAPQVFIAPADLTLSCEEDTSVVFNTIPFFTNNCTGFMVLETFEIIPDPDCPDAYVIERMWSAIDSCGNTTVVTQTVTVRDETAPIVLICPPDTSVDCALPADPGLLGWPIASDNCSSDDALMISYSDDSTGFQACDNGVVGNIQRQFYIEDACGNVDSTCIQLLTVLDTLPPMPVPGTCPADTSVDCSMGNFSNFPIPVYSDICPSQGSISVVVRLDTISGFDGSCSGDTVGHIQRVFLATDGCGNIDSSCVQNIALIDTLAPQVFISPADLTLSCEEDTNILATGFPLFTNNCTGFMLVFDQDVVQDPDCPAAYVIERSWTAIDSCGNANEVTQTITVIDVTGPEVLVCPLDTILDCTVNADPVNAGFPVVQDNCTPNNGIQTTWLDDSTGFDGSCVSGILGQITRHFYIEDACGNIDSSCTQLISVQDTTPPVFDVPADITVDCTTDISNLNILGQLENVSDMCSALVDTTYSDTAIEMPCAGSGTILRTWTVTDACGNSGSGTQVITLEDNEAPVFEAPADITLSCDADPSDLDIAGTVSDVNDNCDPIPLVSYADNVTGLSGCNGTGILVRTWTAMDDCGNTSSATQRIEIEDITPPVVICQDISLSFDESAQVTITPGMIDNGSSDACGPVTLSLSQTQFNCQDFSNTGAMEVTLTATDACGNTSACTAMVFGQGDAGIDLACPSDMEFFLGPEACDLVVEYPVSAETLCGQDPIIEQIDNSGFTSGSAFPIGTTLQEYMAYNDNDTATCSFSITVIEFQDPDAPACNDLVLVSLDTNCQAAITADVVLEGGPYTCYDLYLIDIESVGSGTGVVYVGADQVGQTLVVTVTDPFSGVSCWGTILIEDKLPPVINCAADVTLGCSDSTDPVFFEPETGQGVFEASPGTQIGPDAGTITSEQLQVQFPDGALVTDINVTLDIDHTWSGDLDVFVINPNGVAVELASDLCSSVNDWDNVTFDDEADTDVTSACNNVTPALSGTLRPVGNLADFDGLPANGLWTLQITDDEDGDQGVFQYVALDISYVIGAAYAPEFSDACSEVDLEFFDSESGDMCQGYTLVRTWIATDASGNTASCTQVITREPYFLDEVELPPTVLGECGDNTDPSQTGWPVVDGIPVVQGGTCNLFVTWMDVQIPDCGGGVKIVRNWTVLDWCTQDFFEGTQVIKLTDDQPPILICPQDITVGSDPWFCEADVVLPMPASVVDACGTPVSLLVDAGSLQDQLSGSAPFFVLNDIPEGTWPVTWIATDACGNSSACTFLITVIDDIPPVASCDEHTIVSIADDPLYNRGLTKIPAMVFDDGSYDNCGPVTIRARRMESCIDFDWTTDGAGVDEEPNGTVNSRDRGTVHRSLVPFACCDVGAGAFMVEVQVTDAAGNVNLCMVDVEVQDKLEPFILCPPDVEVSCDFWFHAEATTGFVPQEDDPLTPVFGRILDAYDNHQDEREPVIIDDPANEGISQPHQWGLDGWADDNCDVNIDIRVRIFEDCSGGGLPPGGPANAVRLVERTFRATDAQGNSSTCRQLIWVIDVDPFYISDQSCNNPDPDDGVIWPCDETYSTCPDSIPVHYPQVFDANCSIVAVTYEDEVFSVAADACYKIIRTWTVIDWCQFDAPTNSGIWAYEQVIKVKDDHGPEFGDCPDQPLILCVEDARVSLPLNNQVFLGEQEPNASSCSVHVRLEHVVRETCSEEVTYDVKVYPGNSIGYLQVVPPTTVSVDSVNAAVLVMDTENSPVPQVRLNGLPYNDSFCSQSPLPGGEKDYHRVLWTVEDGCGNVTTCSYLLRLEDCKKPVPVCINGLSTVVMPSSGSVTIWAKDFNASSFDDCTLAADLLYSFSGETYMPAMTFDCAALESNGGPAFVVEIWVADGGTDDNCNAQVSWGERNKDFCTTLIVVDDNEDVCGNTGTAGIGSILTEQDEIISDVSLEYFNIVTGEILWTISSGGYVHICPPDTSVSIRLVKLINPRNGVSTLDLVRIQKHLLGIEEFQSPYLHIAADVDNSGSVSVVDIVELRKLILGIYQDFPHSTSWKFVSRAFVFEDPLDPFPFDEVVSFEQCSENPDILGVKTGDLNFSAAPNGIIGTEIRSGRPEVQLSVGNRTIGPGQEIAVPVFAAGLNTLLGMQFTLHHAGLQLLDIQSGVIDVNAETNSGRFDGHTTLSWSGAIPADLTEHADQPLFSFVFKSNTPVELSTALRISCEVTAAEAYDASEVEYWVRLDFFEKGGNPDMSFALHQNRPNPFDNETAISFQLPSAMPGQLLIHNGQGRLLRTVDGEFHAGDNTIYISAEGLPSGEILYYTLRAGAFSATKKMLLLH